MPLTDMTLVSAIYSLMLNIGSVLKVDKKGTTAEIFSHTFDVKGII